MELHLVSTHHLCAKLCYHLAVNEYHSCLYELVSLTARAYSGVCQELVQTYRLVRVYVRLLVLYALLHAVLGIWIIAWCALSVTATLLVATLTLLSVAATLLEASLALLSVAATLLVATLTWLIASLAWLSIATLTWLETTTWLVAALTWLIASVLFYIVVIPGLIAVCSRTWLIALIALIAVSVATLTLLVGTWLILALLLLSASTLQSGSEALWSEAAFILCAAFVCCVSALRVNAWTLWSPSCTVISLIICGSVAFTAVVTLLCRGVQRFVLHF